MKAEEMCTDDNRERCERAVGLLVGSDFRSERGFEGGLEWADEKFAWRFGGNIVSRTHCR